MADHDGLTRRDLLRLGTFAGPALLATACGWDGGPLVKPRLLALSRVNDALGAKLFSSTRLAREYPVSARSSRVPTYWTADELPELDEPDAWRLQVGGLVRTPTAFSLEMLQALPSVTYTVKHHCVEGWTAVSTWTGVPLETIAKIVQPVDRARFVRFDSFDAGYFNGWDLPSAMHPQTILAYAWNDQLLSPARGAPLRLYSPVKLGYKLTKFLSAVTFTEQQPGGYWEDKGYPWFGGV
jgi:DMSO/TMAO reductase YedYZ molybdopterin-dependent catalytic subunit